MNDTAKGYQMALDDIADALDRNGDTAAWEWIHDNARSRRTQHIRLPHDQHPAPRQRDPQGDPAMNGVGHYAMTVRMITDRAKREILRDARTGVVPSTVASFAELHDHVDANLYGGLCEQNHPLEVASAAQDQLDAWIKTGAIA